VSRKAEAQAFPTATELYQPRSENEQQCREKKAVPLRAL
jgi:hypothetical protein